MLCEYEPRTASKRGIVQRAIRYRIATGFTCYVLVKAETPFPRQGSDSRLKRRSYSSFVEKVGSNSCRTRKTGGACLKVGIMIHFF